VARLTASVNYTQLSLTVAAFIVSGPRKQSLPLLLVLKSVRVTALSVNTVWDSLLQT
jgi:hypothetical protein